MLRIKKGVPYPENIIQEIFYNPDIEITEDMKDGFYHALGSLNDLQQDVLYLRYAKQKTLKQTKEELNLTDYRTKDLILRSVRALRHPRMLRYIKYGLNYVNTLEKEEIMRQERYSNEAYFAGSSARRLRRNKCQNLYCFISQRLWHFVRRKPFH